jgi:hypothetical protein
MSYLTEGAEVIGGFEIFFHCFVSLIAGIYTFGSCASIFSKCYPEDEEEEKIMTKKRRDENRIRDAARRQ